MVVHEHAMTDDVYAWSGFLLLLVSIMTITIFVVIILLSAAASAGGIAGQARGQRLYHFFRNSKHLIFLD